MANRTTQELVSVAPYDGRNLRTTIIDYRNSVGALPTDPDQSNTLGDLYVRAGRIDDAIACFSQAAEVYRRNGSMLRAIAILKKISRLNPGDPEIAIRLGDLFARQGLIAEARMSYLSAGDSKYISGDAEGAIQAYEKVISLDPSNGALLGMLGGLYEELGMLRQAHSVFSDARREHLKTGKFGLAREANSRARTVEAAASHFHHLQGDRDRRREERYPMRLGALVVSDNRKWREFTQTVNISRSGLRFALSRAVEPDTILKLQLPLPSGLNLNTEDDRQYVTSAIVCNCTQTESGANWIGAEFGMLAPAS